jgi:hypothetical protein
MTLRFLSTARIGAILAGGAAMTLTPASARAADPTTADCLAATEAALKSGDEHRLRGERSQLLICAAASCPADIRATCSRRVGEVNAAMPTIVFEARDASGNDLSAVKVTMDGEVLAERLEGTALSIDPGEHTFVFESNQTQATRQLVVAEAEKDRRVLVVFPPPPNPPPPPPPARGGEHLPPTGQDTPPAHDPGAQRVAGVVVAGLGIASLGVGTAFGVAALSKRTTAQSACPDRCPTQTGVDDWNDAASTGNVSTALLLVGGGALAIASVLWFTAPSGQRSSAQLIVGPSGIQVSGTW